MPDQGKADALMGHQKTMKAVYLANSLLNGQGGQGVYLCNRCNRGARRGIVHQPQSDIDQWLFVEAARHEALLGTIWQHTD